MSTILEQGRTRCSSIHAHVQCHFLISALPFTFPIKILYAESALTFTSPPSEIAPSVVTGAGTRVIWRIESAISKQNEQLIDDHSVRVEEVFVDELRVEHHIVRMKGVASLGVDCSDKQFIASYVHNRVVNVLGALKRDEHGVEHHIIEDGLDMLKGQMYRATHTLYCRRESNLESVDDPQTVLRRRGRREEIENGCRDT